MKTTHIIGILVIAVAIVLIMTTAGDASQYLDFREAKDLADKGSKSQIHVVGQLKKDLAGEVVGIQPSDDMLSFSFTMVDENGKEQVVYHPNPMPTDFIRSEQVVIVGSFHQDRFVADKILLKCPSKYQEKEIHQ
ncbi:MAG: cytochrome c maturation protein CcmE [Cytophagales bacterium]|nr:cytochrome c maturation protein CcmE [Cytophagales bacterium]